MFPFHFLPSRSTSLKKFNYTNADFDGRIKSWVTQLLLILCCIKMFGNMVRSTSILQGTFGNDPSSGILAYFHTIVENPLLVTTLIV